MELKIYKGFLMEERGNSSFENYFALEMSEEKSQIFERTAGFLSTINNSDEEFVNRLIRLGLKVVYVTPFMNINKISDDILIGMIKRDIHHTFFGYVIYGDINESYLLNEIKIFELRHSQRINLYINEVKKSLFENNTIQYEGYGKYIQDSEEVRIKFVCCKANSTFIFRCPNLNITIHEKDNNEHLDTFVDIIKYLNSVCNVNIIY